jgi:hypothetical protein
MIRGGMNSRFRTLSRILSDLRACSRTFDGSQRRRKTALLQQAARLDSTLTDPRELAEYHETLLFIAAFPDDARIHARAEAALKRLAKRLRDGGGLDRRSLRILAGSGIAGTFIEYGYTLDSLRWLSRRFPRDIEFVWRDDSLGETFDELLASLAFGVEYDGLLEPRFSAREWVRLAAGDQGEIEWVVQQFDRLLAGRCADASLLDRVFDSQELMVRWRLRDALASRTLCRFPPRSRFLHAPRERALPAPNPADVVVAPLPAARRCSVHEAGQLIDVARAALAVRSRETDPVAYATPRDVVLHRLERGVDVLLIGMQPHRRLPIEGFIGYVAAKNRIPIAYGGGWVAFDTCTVGINLFDTFRGGESAHIFAQILRVYRGTFNVRTFRVDPYQFGEDNEEAIKSGAFWFYHRFGFRPTDPDLRALAEHEAEKIARDRAYRSSRATLRRLATSRMQMNVVQTSEPDLDLGAASLAVTRWIAERFAGDRPLAAANAIRHVATALAAERREDWPKAEQASFESLAMLMALIPDLDRWPPSERAALLRIMRGRGGPSEMAYLRALRAHARLRAAVVAIAQAENALTAR